MIQLLPRKLPTWRGGLVKAFQISASRPFITAGPDLYTHRVRSAQLLTDGESSWVACDCWCGAVRIASGKERRRRRKPHVWALTNEPPEGGSVCATCEGRAIGAGMIAAREIAGRPVVFSPHGFAA